MITERERLKKVNEKINSVGCGFCLAKWTQVTIQLQTGRTHSCHHPTTHQIPLKEIKRNPSALHNTKFKKLKRKEMLENKRPAECEYCWKIEDSSNELSDRTYKSAEPWSDPYFDEIKELGWRADYNPKYVEVAFSNACNFKCSYCGPSFSSKWVEEIKNYGAYPTTDNFNDLDNLKEWGEMPYKHTEYNPYVEAFWKWWPDLYNDLDTFRITGGEPLMNKDTWDILDFILEQDNPNTDLKLAINTNLGIPDKLVNKFIEKITKIEKEGRVKEISIFTSCDTAGNHAEYVRTGLDYQKFTENIDKILSATKKTCVIIMSTFNALSILRYKELMEFVYQMKKKYNNPDRYWVTALTLDSSYLRYPAHQTVKILPDEYIGLVENLAEYAEDRDTLLPLPKIPEDSWEKWMTGFTEIETSKIRRIADYMKVKVKPAILSKNRYNFYKHFTEHDKRRNTDFVSTFPELESFWDKCKKVKPRRKWTSLNLTSQ